VIAVVKVGSSSVTPETVAGSVTRSRGARAGHTVVVVTSAPSPPAGRARPREQRPSDPAVLQAVSASASTPHAAVAGRPRSHGLLAGQVLLAPLDFVHRTSTARARDAAPLVDSAWSPSSTRTTRWRTRRSARRQRSPGRAGAHLVGAELLVLLTDTPGLLTADPRGTRRRRSLRRSSRSTPAGATGRRPGSTLGSAAWRPSWRARSPPVRRAGRDRRPGRPGVLAAALAGRPASDRVPGRKAGSRRASSGSPSPGSSGGSRSTRGTHGAGRARALAPGRGCRGGQRRLRARGRVEIAGPTGGSSQGLVRLHASGRGVDGAPQPGRRPPGRPGPCNLTDDLAGIGAARGPRHAAARVVARRRARSRRCVAPGRRPPRGRASSLVAATGSTWSGPRPRPDRAARDRLRLTRTASRHGTRPAQGAALPTRWGRSPRAGCGPTACG